MWLFTDKGFISVVAFDPKMDKQKRSRRQRKSWGSNPVLVRARIKNDIEQIRPFWSKLRIEKDDSADYEFRAVVPRKRWVDFVASKADEIDYGSHFKEVAQSRSPGGFKEGTERHSAYMSVWSAMAKMQPDAPYSGNKWYTSYQGSSSKYGTSDYYFGSSALCTEKMLYTRKDDSGKDVEYRRWCNERQGHKGDHKFGNETRVLPVYTPYKKDEGDSVAESSKIETHPYDSTNPYAMPDSVEDMCKELMNKVPDDIVVDPATPYATYDLWARACEEFKEPMTADQILDVLDELIEDDLTVEEAKMQYIEAAHKFTAGYYIDIADDFARSDADDESLSLTEEKAKQLKSDKAFDEVVAELDLSPTFIPEQ